jgi:membrane protein DedA with SNARE-associated domain
MKETASMSYVEQFLNFLDTLPNALIYLFLGLSAFVENIFPPIPGDTITAFGAFLVGTDRLHFFWVYFVTTLGSLVGFLVLFWLGLVLGRHFFLERDYRFFRSKDIVKAEDWFQKYGYLLILVNRFLPGIRSAISLAGGISRLNIPRVVFLAFLSCAAWNLIWISVGYALGNNWDKVKGRISEILASYNIAVFTLLGLAVLYFIVKRMSKKRKT